MASSNLNNRTSAAKMRNSLVASASLQVTASSYILTLLSRRVTSNVDVGRVMLRHSVVQSWQSVLRTQIRLSSLSDVAM
jgi:hypothetical protein